MTLPEEAGHPDSLVLKDPAGITRVVLGRLDDGAEAGSETYGLSLRGADGRERVALSVDDHGPTLVFVRAGNIAIQLGVDDPVLDGDHTGAFITLADADGTPLLHVSAQDDGSLQIRSALQPRPESA